MTKSLIRNAQRETHKMLRATLYKLGIGHEYKHDKLMNECIIHIDNIDTYQFRYTFAQLVELGLTDEDYRLIRECIDDLYKRTKGPIPLSPSYNYAAEGYGEHLIKRWHMYKIPIIEMSDIFSEIRYSENPSAHEELNKKYKGPVNIWAQLHICKQEK